MLGAQYALEQPDFQSANAVDSYGPATGVNAYLEVEFSISGSVTAPGATTGTAGVCVTVDDAAGNLVDSAKTAADGTYQIQNLPPARIASTSTRPAPRPRRAPTSPSTTAGRWQPAPPSPSTCERM